MHKLLLYLCSIRYLKLTQIFGRLLVLVRRKILHRFSIYTARYLCQTAEREQVVPIEFPLKGYCPGDLQNLNHNTFTFLNRRASLGEPINWFPQDQSQLWIYNLHYFDYAVSLGLNYVQSGDSQIFGIFRRLAREWMHHCPVAKPLAWDPYPLSLRIKNWIMAYTLFEPALCQDASFAAELRHSLYTQARFLEDNLEYHLLGNHLIENGRALLYAGLFFGGQAAERWRQKGEQILWRELREQFLDDGGHYEQSPMYHQIMLELYQQVVSVLSVRGYVVPDNVKNRIEAMQDWLCAVCHPDGEISLFNDAAFDMAGHFDDCSKVSTVKALSDSGYFVFRDHSAQNFMIFDCGLLGPDHQPGHGHCDMLSYELSLSGQRFIVDSGVGNYYGELDWRTYYRSTRAHNTVVVDGIEQSEIWNRFRVARRAYPLDVKWADKSPALAYVAGSHTGYRRLKGRVTHRRWMCWIDRRFWLVCDRVTGQGWHQTESLIHFHPQIQVVSVPRIATHRQSGEVRHGQTSLRIIPWGVQDVTTYFGETDPIQAWYAPEFGLRIRNPVWGLNRADELPFWLGYVLWPETTNAAVQFSSINEHSCHVDVQSVDVLYHIVFTPTDVTLEKEC